MGPWSLKRSLQKRRLNRSRRHLTQTQDPQVLVPWSTRFDRFSERR